MDLYKRIKARREELEMTQEELAQLVGYKSRSSVNKIEMGENDIPQSKIQEFANALHTTPAYLMGWIDDSTNYEDPELVASLSPELLRHFDGNVKKAVAAQRAIEKDQEDDSNKRYAIDTIAARLEDKELTPKKIKLLENYIDALFDEDDEE